MLRSAVISRDGVYRYRLSRRWGDGGRIAWIMLNPSTADAYVDDPTIRRCIGFSRAWGYGSMEVVNLFALRSSEPAMLRHHEDPVGPDNDRHISRAVRMADATIAAWGGFTWARDRARIVQNMAGPRLACLGLNRGGSPRHPLYVPGRFRPVELGPCRA